MSSGNKTLLVARREFFENLRTKTFWIGILFMPIMLSFMVVVPSLLDKTKDRRRFAVLDKSDMLLPLVEQEGRLPDFEKVFRRLRKLAIDEDPDLLELDQALQVWARTLAGLPEESLGELAVQLADFQTPGSRSRQAVEKLPEQYREAIRRNQEQIDRQFDALRDYWIRMSADDAKKVASGLSRSRYELVRLDELGIGAGDDAEAILKKRVDQGDLFAYFVIGEDPVSDSNGCEYVSNNVTDGDLREWFSALAGRVVRRMRFSAREIDRDTMNEILSPLKFSQRRVAEGGGSTEDVGGEEMTRQWIPMAFTYVLWMAIMSISQMLLTNTVEEKSNRIIEVLLSSVSPFQLMGGKILGIASTGLTVILAWIVFFILVIKLVPVLFDVNVPDYMASVMQDPAYLTSFVFYFLSGYMLYASILVGIGSVCNSLKEAQNLQMPVMLLLILPLASMFPVTQDPNGTLAQVLSYIPFFTPFIMMNRAAGPPTTMEYLVTSAILLVSIGICVWAAGRIFRIGVLMTGKPPRLREIFSWLRTPAGEVPVSND